MPAPLSQKYAATFQDVQQAAARIAPFAHRTPVYTCRSLDEMAGRSIFFKCEHLQKVGAFKFRGACNAISRLSDQEAARGVVTHSSGNHAQALALAAKMRGIPAWIVMPENSNPVKRRAVEGYGATVISCAPVLKDRETTAAAVVAETGALLVHSYNHPDIIAGQGTSALELHQEIPDLDAILTPLGGGGLLSGTCIATRGARPEVRIFAAEPAGADDAARSMKAGHFIAQTDPQTIADGLRTSMGDLTWPIIRDHVEAICTVEEDEIRRATRLLWERAKLLVEPSSAVVLAALLAPRHREIFRGVARIGAILSGGNVDLDDLPF